MAAACLPTSPGITGARGTRGRTGAEAHAIAREVPFGPIATTDQSAENLAASVSPLITPSAPPLTRSGYLGESALDLGVSASKVGDLEVLAAVNDTWAQHVSSVTGGGVRKWSSAGAPSFDGKDGQVMQIWYGQVSSAGPSQLTVTWGGKVANADVAEQEFSAGAGAHWSLAAEAGSPRPFPALRATDSPELYFGAAMAWGDAAAGGTPGVSYDVANRGFLVAWSTHASGPFAPRATGAGSVAALFSVTDQSGKEATPARAHRDATKAGSQKAKAGRHGAKRDGGSAKVGGNPAKRAKRNLKRTNHSTRPAKTKAKGGQTKAQPGETKVRPSKSKVRPGKTRAQPGKTKAQLAGRPGGNAAGRGAPGGSLWPHSLFNSDVEGWAVDPRSASFAADIVGDYESHYGSVGVNTAPIYDVPAGQADVAVSVRPGCNNFTPDTGSEIPVPPEASLNGSSDSPLVLYQPSTETEWELWQASRGPDGTYSACWGGKLDMASSDGVFPSPYGLSATGISYLATTITEADVASGSIDHAIAVVVPRCNSDVYPADRTDCGADPGQPAEGQWFRFAPGTPMPAGLSPFAQMVFRAIERYGMVVVDQGGAVMIEAEQPSDWAAEGHTGTNPLTASWAGQPEYKVVASLPWSSLQAVDPPQG
ncbi:MAG: hypothetical protein ACRDZX_03260 [Acidimicrobiales bacterium]